MTVPLAILDELGQWQAVPGITRIAIEEQHAYEPPPEAVSWGEALGFLTDERQSVERAMAILAPHLANEPLYRPTEGARP